MKITSPIVEQPYIKETIIYELYELIRAYPEWFFIGTVIVILNYIVFRK